MRAKFVFEAFEEENLSPGERRAANQGLDVLTKSQLAAIYLAAKDAMGRSEDTRGRGDTGLTRNARKMTANVETSFEKLSGYRLADVLSLKPRTVNYTMSKFRLLLQGNREGTESNVLYDKLINAFDEFEKMTPANVYALAIESVDLNADFSRSEQYQEQTAEQARLYKIKKDKEDKSKGNEIRSYFSAYKQHMDPIKAAIKTANYYANKYNTTTDEIKRIAKLTFKNDPVFLKYWK